MTEGSVPANKSKSSTTPSRTKSKASVMRLPVLPLFSWVLLGLSVLLLICTGIVIDLHGNAAYFALFHKPLSFTSSAKFSSYKPAVLPTFIVHPTISSRSLSIGDTQTLYLSASADKTVGAFVQVWIKGPHGNEVFRSPSTQPFTFSAGKTYAFNFQYTIPSTLPAGKYFASVIMESTDTNTDYYVNENFASFGVQ